MKRFVFLNADKEEVVKLKTSTESALSELEESEKVLEIVKKTLTEPKKGLNFDELENAGDPESILVKLKRIVELFKSIEKPQPEPEVNVAPYLISADHKFKFDPVEFDSLLQDLRDGVQIEAYETYFSSYASEQYLSDLAKFLNRKLRNLERCIKNIINLINRIGMDKRARYRSIVKLLFKNLDDEHSAVNNLNAFKSYLRINPHYGNPELKTVTCNSRAIAA